MFADKTDFLIYMMIILLGVFLIAVSLFYIDLKNRINNAEENLENLIGELLVEKEELGKNDDGCNMVLTETWKIDTGDGGSVDGEELKGILKEILEKKYGERKDNN